MKKNESGLSSIMVKFNINLFTDVYLWIHGLTL